MIQLTIAVPAYNSELFLEKCLSSMVINEYMDMLEVIVVNDGSLDNTADIAERFVKRYPRTFKLISKKNAGHGSGVNVAISAASGRYFKVVDADDWVNTSNLKDLLFALKKTNADVVINGYETVDCVTGKRKSYSSVCRKNDVVIDMPQLMEEYNNIAPCCSLHGLTYRTEVYRKSNTVLSENISYDDNEYAILPFCVVSSVLILSFPLYQYRVGDVNQSMSVVNQVNRLHQKERIILNILNHMPDACGSSYYSRRAIALLVGYYATALIMMPNKKDGRKAAKAFRKQIKRFDFTKAFEAKYIFLCAANYLHLPPDLYFKAVGNDSIRRLFRKCLK